MKYFRSARETLILGESIRDTGDMSLRMLQGDRSYSFDRNLVLTDGVTLTASGYVTGSPSGVDMGGNQNVTITLPSIADSSSITPQQARADAVLVVDLTACDVSSADETYKMLVVGSNDPAFGAGKVASLGGIQLGVAGQNDIPNGITTPAPAAVGGSRYEILFCTEQNNVKYEFVSLYIVLGGTTPSITLKAFIAVLPIA